MSENSMAQRRRDNLFAWMDKREINKTDLSVRLGRSKSYTYLLFHPDRFFGEKAARSIEEVLGMAPGELDQEPGAPGARAAGPVMTWESPSDLSPGDYAMVPRVAVQLSAGNGALVDVPLSLPPLAFREDWLRRQRVSARTNLRVCDVRGPSMEPYLYDGDVVLIDLGQTDVEDAEVYALLYGDELRIKRLSRRFDGGLLIRSDNRDFQDESLQPKDMRHVRVLGRCLWRGG